MNKRLNLLIPILLGVMGMVIIDRFTVEPEIQYKIATQTRVVRNDITKIQRVKTADSITSCSITRPDGTKEVTVKVENPSEIYSLNVDKSVTTDTKTDVVYTEKSRTYRGVTLGAGYPLSYSFGLQYRLFSDIWLGANIAGEFESLDWKDYSYWITVSYYF